MAVLQSPGSSQVSMVMVAGDPFTATGTTVGEPRGRAPPSASPERQLRVCPGANLTSTLSAAAIHFLAS